MKFNLLSFARTALGFDKITVGQHGHIIKLLQSAYSPSTKAQNVILILLPRASYKTTIASVAYPMWLLHDNPDLRIMIDSETYSLSKKILSEIKQHYTSATSAFAQTPFTLCKSKTSSFERWAEDSIIVPTRRTPKKEGSIDAAGVDGVKAGTHYDIIIADDLHSQNNTRTPYQIEQVIEHYRLLLSILEPNGTLIVIGTRWTIEDAYTVVSQDANAVLFIPAVSIQEMNVGSEHCVSESRKLVYDAVANEAVEATEFFANFPDALPISHLKKIEERQGPYIYSAQYVLRPVSDRDKRFRDEWLKPLPAELPPRCRLLGMVDPAFTTQEYSDYTGVVIAAIDDMRNVYVVHDEEKKLEPFNLIEYLFDLSDAYNVHEWFIEEVAAQRVLRFFLEYMAVKQKRRLVFSPVKSYGRKKDVRIQSLQPYFAAGKFFVKEDGPLRNQLRQYPLCKNDDVLDALAYLPQVMYDGGAPLPMPAPIVTGIRMSDLLSEQMSFKQEGLRPRGWTETRRIKCYIPNGTRCL